MDMLVAAVKQRVSDSSIQNVTNVDNMKDIVPLEWYVNRWPLLYALLMILCPKCRWVE